MQYHDVLANDEYTAEQRIQATFQLMKKNDTSSIHELIKGLQSDTSPIVRHECAYCLGEIDNKKGVQTLIAAILEDDNPFVKHEAALALSNLGPPEAKSIIRTLLDHHNPDVVETGKISLKRWDMQQNQEKIEEIGDPYNLILDLDSSPEYRIQASFKLLEENTEPAIDTLLKALEQETNAIVKHEIIFCLGEVASHRVVNPLIKHMLEDDNAFVKHEAALALATLNDPAAKNAIHQLKSHDNQDVVESAEIALERLQR